MIVAPPDLAHGREPGSKCRAGGCDALEERLRDGELVGADDRRLAVEPQGLVAADHVDVTVDEPRDKRPALEVDAQVVALAHVAAVRRHALDPVALQDDNTVVERLARPEHDVCMVNRDSHRHRLLADETPGSYLDHVVDDTVAHGEQPVVEVYAAAGVVRDDVQPVADRRALG